MIHSLSGGVLADGGLYTFAKVELRAGPRWFLSPFPVSVGERVLAPSSAGTEEGTVLKVEVCTRQTAPIPVNRAEELEKKAENP